MRIRWWVAAAVLFACGRTPVYKGAKVSSPPTGCSIEVDLDHLDFGTVKPELPYDLEVMVENTGTAACHLRSLEIARESDPGFSRPAPAPSDLTLAPGDQAPLLVRFLTDLSAPPFDRAGKLTFESDDPQNPSVSIALKAHLPHCNLEAPPKVDLGLVEPFTTTTAPTALTNSGDLTCVLTGFSLAGDPGFNVQGEPVTPADLPPGGTLQLTVAFSSGPVPPFERHAHLDVTEKNSAHPKTIDLTATLKVCVIGASPSPFDFGNVMLNTTATHSLSVSNNGTDDCRLSGLGLDSTTDPGFSLPNPQALPATLAPGASASVPISFAALDSSPPHLRNGALRFSASDPVSPTVTVPLSAFINTVCTQAGQYIYTIDNSASTLSRFDPATLTSTVVGNLACPTTETPFSMNIDQTGTAWILYWDGAPSDPGHIFKVDVNTADCQATSYVGGQSGMGTYGMGSAFDPVSGIDTLYIAGGTPFPDLMPSLASLDLATLTVHVIGPMTLPGPELAGTGDGQLWGFSPTDFTGGVPVIARIDPLSGATLESYDLAAVTTSGTGFAVKFWGGSFYIFLGPDVWQVERSSLVPGMSAPTKTPLKVLTTPGLDVVGAGVSTCAPLLPPN